MYDLNDRKLIYFSNYINYLNYYYLKFNDEVLKF